MASIGLLLAVFGVFVQGVPASEARSQGIWLSPPTAQEGPLVIDVGFHVIDFGRVTAREESFEATVYLELRWRDPRLADASHHGNWVPNQKIWFPRFLFENAADAPRAHGDPIIEVEPDGTVNYETILSGRFSAPLDLRAFPFDTQVLPVRVSLFDDESQVKFRLDPEHSRMHDDAFVTDWLLGEPSIKVQTREYSHGGQYFSSLVHEVEIHRRSTFYIWRVLLPLILLPAVSFIIFWVDPPNIQPQISTCMATLVALVTFQFAVDFALPKVTYLTLVDRQALIGFLIVAMEILIVCLVHIAVRNGHNSRAVALQAWCRVGFPVAYASAVILNLAPSVLKAFL